MQEVDRLGLAAGRCAGRWRCGRPRVRLHRGTRFSPPARPGPHQLRAAVTGGDNGRVGYRGWRGATLRAGPGARLAVVDTVSVATAERAHRARPPGQSHARRRRGRVAPGPGTGLRTAQRVLSHHPGQLRAKLSEELGDLGAPIEFK